MEKSVAGQYNIQQDGVVYNLFSVRLVLSRCDKQAMNFVYKKKKKRRRKNK